MDIAGRLFIVHLENERAENAMAIIIAKEITIYSSLIWGDVTNTIYGTI